MAIMKKSVKKITVKKAPAKAAPMMKMGGKMKKYKAGGSVDSYTDYAKTSGKEDSYTDYSGKTSKPDSYTEYKKGGVVKAKKGGSFPDLNKDGKITKADILKGRGVIAKKGAALKKQAAVAIAMKKAGKTPKTMKSGGAMKKCAYGCK